MIVQEQAGVPRPQFPGSALCIATLARRRYHPSRSDGERASAGSRSVLLSLHLRIPRTRPESPS